MKTDKREFNAPAPSLRAPTLDSPFLVETGEAMVALRGLLSKEIERIQAANLEELDRIRVEAVEKAKVVLAVEIERARAHIDEAEERANSQLAQAHEIERVGTAQFRTWVKNYPVPPDGELLSTMARDGTLVGWFTRYAQWLREVGENPRIPVVSR